jgi:hypothetical protein
MSSEEEILSDKLREIGDQIDLDYVRMGARSMTWTGDPNNNEQIDLVSRYNKILEKIRLLSEKKSQSGGRYRKSRKNCKSRKNRKSRKKRRT